MEFKDVGGLANTHINIYLDYHPFDNQQWSKLREYARKTTHIIQFHSKGEMIQHDWACFTCHGIDHPLGLCPFNNLEIDIPLSRPLVPKPRIMTNEGNSNSYQTARPTQMNNTGQQGSFRGRGRGPRGGNRGQRGAPQGRGNRYSMPLRDRLSREDIVSQRYIG